jgi:hypothetical protein
MRFGLSTTLSFFVVFMLGTVTAQAQVLPEVPVPVDPSTPVIVLKYTGGFVPNPSAEPALLVRADTPSWFFVMCSSTKRKWDFRRQRQLLFRETRFLLRATTERKREAVKPRTSGMKQ